MEMLIKFEYKFELPQFWIEKTYLTWMIVDIVEHQNKLYHIKGPWQGNHKYTNSPADKTDQIISSVGNRNQIGFYCAYFVDISGATDLQGDMLNAYLKTSHMRQVRKGIGWRISEL